MSPPVTMAEYDPRWPILYEQEKALILRVIGGKVVAIEHIGSTAVPGLGAKPIIDIMIAVRYLADAAECITPLRSIGYEYVPEYEVELPERRYFRKGPPGARTHHVHMVEHTSNFWERHLLFRDFLRAHPQVAQRYYGVKMALAAKYGADRKGYTDAKRRFIESVIRRARRTRA